jgi:hypothetical protein
MMMIMYHKSQHTTLYKIIQFISFTCTSYHARYHTIYQTIHNVWYYINTISYHNKHVTNLCAKSYFENFINHISH